MRLRGLDFADGHRMRMIVAALLVALLLTAGALLSREPTVTIGNGPLEGWQVVRDNETLLCEDPIVFVAAKQIECP